MTNSEYWGRWTGVAGEQVAPRINFVLHPPSDACKVRRSRFYSLFCRSCKFLLHPSWQAGLPSWQTTLTLRPAQLSPQMLLCVTHIQGLSRQTPSPGSVEDILQGQGRGHFPFCPTGSVTDTTFGGGHVNVSAMNPHHGRSLGFTVP